PARRDGPETASAPASGVAGTHAGTERTVGRRLRRVARRSGHRETGRGSARVVPGDEPDHVRPGAEPVPAAPLPPRHVDGRVPRIRRGGRGGTARVPEVPGGVGPAPDPQLDADRAPALTVIPGARPGRTPTSAPWRRRLPWRGKCVQRSRSAGWPVSRSA